MFSLKLMSSAAFRWFGPTEEGITTLRFAPDRCWPGDCCCLCVKWVAERTSRGG